MEKKTLLQKVKAIKTPSDLEKAFGFDFDIIEISYRGGVLGFYASSIAELVGVDEDLLPTKFGAFCNYLGGGLRGSICPSTFSSEIPKQKANLLNEIAQAVVRCYNFLEKDNDLQEEEDLDGEINWDNLGTNKIRQSGIVSAY